MKKIGVIFIIMLSFNLLNAQELTYSTVINTDSVGVSKIYTTLLEWVSDNYSYPSEVIQVDDDKSGLLVLKGIMEYSYSGMSYGCYSGYIDYTIKIQVKENRYKVEFSNFKHRVKAGNSSSCELGLITIADEYTEYGMQKKFDNNVWNDIKFVTENFANEIFWSMEDATDIIGTDNDEDKW